MAPELAQHFLRSMSYEDRGYRGSEHEQDERHSVLLSLGDAENAFSVPHGPRVVNYAKGRPQGH
jgi:hypothetical protein